VQASCPSCQQKIVIDDAKVPDRAFSVKCPKCATVVKFPGKAAAAAAPPPEAPAFDPGPPPASAPSMDDVRAEMAQLRKEMGTKAPGSLGKVLIAGFDRDMDQALSAPLTQAGFTVEDNDNADQGGRLIEQGVYNVVITTRGQGVQKGVETVYQRSTRMSPEQRRRVFVVLVGEEFKSGDGTQAYAMSVDLVLSPRDVSNAGALIATTLNERNRLYQIFVDAKQKFEALQH
jgi:predicted Zn finger-like uncharacterized protein